MSAPLSSLIPDPVRRRLEREMRAIGKCRVWAGDHRGLEVDCEFLSVSMLVAQLEWPKHQCETPRCLLSLPRVSVEMPSKHRRKKSTCLRGHPRTRENVHGNGSCKVCSKAHMARYRKRARQDRKAAS